MRRGAHRGRAVGLACFGAVILGACAAGPSQSLNPADCAHADASGVVVLTAKRLAFDAPCITVAVDTAFSIRLVNEDTDRHDVAVYDSRDKVNEYLRGEKIGPGETITYPMDPLPAGEYFFTCVVHSVDMRGTLFVVPSD